MTSSVLIVLAIAGIIALGILRALVVSLLAGEVKAALAARLRSRLERAVALLPPHVADDLGDEWRAELEAYTERPLAALRFAQGLQVAASAIAAAPPTAPERTSESPTGGKPPTNRSRPPLALDNVEPQLDLLDVKDDRTTELGELFEGFSRFARPLLRLSGDEPVDSPLKHASGEQLLALLAALAEPRSTGLRDRAYAKFQSGFVHAVQRLVEGADLDDLSVRPLLLRFTEHLVLVDQQIRDLDEPLSVPRGVDE
jgi:hypothetical protein